jgi:hypothetical protein
MHSPQFIFLLEACAWFWSEQIELQQTNKIALTGRLKIKILSMQSGEHSFYTMR